MIIENGDELIDGSSGSMILDGGESGSVSFVNVEKKGNGLERK